MRAPRGRKLLSSPSSSHSSVRRGPDSSARLRNKGLTVFSSCSVPATYLMFYIFSLTLLILLTTLGGVSFIIVLDEKLQWRELQSITLPESKACAVRRRPLSSILIFTLEIKKLRCRDVSYTF